MTADKLVPEFKTVVGEENGWNGAFELHVYSCDAAVVDPVRPGLVVRPTTVDALSRTFRLRDDHGLPLTVRQALPAIPSN